MTSKRSAIGLASAAFLLNACDAGRMTAPEGDRTWTVAAAQSCPPVAAQVDRALSDDLLTNDEVDAVAAAIRTIVEAPVRGQTCDPGYSHRPSASDGADASMLIPIISTI